MIIGIPKEIKNNEYRVGLMPKHVNELSKKNEVLVQSSAGTGSSFTDNDYINAGAKIVNSIEEIYYNSELIVKVKEPLLKEYNLIQPKQKLFTFFHFAASEELTLAMMKTKSTCIAYETIEDDSGKLPLLTPMSEVAGRLAGQQAAKFMEKPQGGSGILVGGVTGTPPAKAIVLGGGTVGTNAADVLVGMGAEVLIFDINKNRLDEIKNEFKGKVKTVYSSIESLKEHLPTTDTVIGAVLVTGAKAPKLITKDMLKIMKPKTVLVDVSVDQGGCFETTKPTTHSEPTYYVDDILHYAVANMPGAVPRTSTHALSNCTFPYAKILSEQTLVNLDDNFKKGINIFNGYITNKEVADAFKLPYSSLNNFLN